MLVKKAFKIKRGAVRKIAGFFWDNNSFIFELLKYGFRNMVSSARVLESHFAIACLLMSIQPEAFLPVLAATGTAEGFTVPGQVFDIREMVLIEVEVDRAGILAVRAAKQGGCNVGCVFFIFIFPWL